MAAGHLVPPNAGQGQAPRPPTTGCLSEMSRLAWPCSSIESFTQPAQMVCKWRRGCLSHSEGTRWVWCGAEPVTLHVRTGWALCSKILTWLDVASTLFLCLSFEASERCVDCATQGSDRNAVSKRPKQTCVNWRRGEPRTWSQGQTVDHRNTIANLWCKLGIC